MLWPFTHETLRMEEERLRPLLVQGVDWLAQLRAELQRQPAIATSDAARLQILTARADRLDARLQGLQAGAGAPREAAELAEQVVAVRRTLAQRLRKELGAPDGSAGLRAVAERCAAVCTHLQQQEDVLRRSLRAVCDRLREPA